MDIVLSIAPHTNSLAVALHFNALTITPHENTLTVEPIDIYTHRYFLQPFQVLERHEEV